MDEPFSLTWEDSTTVVQTEEVICGIENEILPSESEEFTGLQEETVTEEIVTELKHEVIELVDDECIPDIQETQEIQEDNVDNLMYLDENVLVVNNQSEQLLDCQMTEDIITCAEEIVDGSHEGVGIEEVSEEYLDIPLTTDQDEYSAARPHPCEFCNRRFRKKANLMNHMVAHQTDRPHGCNLCGARYIRKCDLMNHLKTHAYIPEVDGLEDENAQTVDELDDSGEKKKKKQLVKKKKKKVKEEYDQFEDNIAASSSRTFNYVEEDVKMMEQMTNNIKQDYDYIPQEEIQQPTEIRYPVRDPKKPFVCQHCGVGFAREKAMISHIRLHSEGDSPFECQKCGEMYWDMMQMKDHIKEKHGDVDDYEDDDDEDYSEEETKYGTYYCSTCGLSFHRQDNLRRHQRIHVKDEFGHICNVCGESFQEALDLLAHAEVHARILEYKCMICGENAEEENLLAVHVQAKHGKNLPPHSCMLCGRSCKDRRTLLKHTWEHSKEKMFACTKCDKTFHSKARLKRHMFSHRNKVVTCDVCGDEFSDGRTLMNHRHSHSSVSGRQFPCRECGKTFGSRSSQQIHIRIHTGERPYGCKYCWKAFADGGTLRKHERIHTGEKPYACAVCPRAFNQRVVLREHIRSHHSGPDPKYSNSMTPFCCSVCSDMFATSQDLILHLIHHCDMNTAMKRQPQIGPRKYKRRRKLKPHELELMSSRIEDGENEQSEDLGDNFTDSEEEKERKRRYTRRQQTKKPQSPESPKESVSDSFAELYNSVSSTIENINSLVNSKSSPKSKQIKKLKSDQSISSRPKMIHTQKTRVPVEAGEDGRIRHKTKTLVTRTQPTEIKTTTAERVRPRTKNVNYHILQEKLPRATFDEAPKDPTQEAVDNLLKQENVFVDPEPEPEHLDQHSQPNNGIIYMDQFEEPPEVASEQTIESESPSTVEIKMMTRSRANSNSLKPGRHIIGPGSKVRMVKEGMVISKNRNKKSESENEYPADSTPLLQHIKQEDPSPLHELAEISMQHANANAQNLFKCEMCSEVFTDRAQLLVHVPIHI
ncbi:zinc finger protein 569 isoform X1 [Diabrotica virgifera virgifera]|uniref:Zinc finger protein 569 isoform X1 n=1 Tax=Diabrotica virgifera virgifera TaxID=50390 RepID=A0A6P7F9U1_DIAVI|nr:zinc finger protein 569 isoform X1 [Diabrotica virgifera virgifera]